MLLIFKKLNYAYVSFFLTLNFFKDVEGNQKRYESGDCQAICLKFIVVLQLSRFYDHDTILSAF